MSESRLLLSNFTILEEFMGCESNKIYLVVDKKTNQKLIFKRIKIIELQNQLREIQAHKNLKHANIVELLRFQVNTEYIDLLIEYASKGDLFDFINSLDSILESKILRMFYQIVIAVDFIHCNGFIHRDIKPENILVTECLTPKLADFGSSVSFEHVRNTFCGTFEYMAPEVYLRQRQTEKVDIWALGVLLFEMTHNYIPFQEKDLEEIYTIITEDKIPFNDQISFRVQRIIKSILILDPEGRPSAKDILFMPELKVFAKEFKNQINQNERVNKQRAHTVYKRYNTVKSSSKEVRNKNESVNKKLKKDKTKKNLKSDKEKIKNDLILFGKQFKLPKPKIKKKEINFNFYGLNKEAKLKRDIFVLREKLKLKVCKNEASLRILKKKKKNNRFKIHNPKENERKKEKIQNSTIPNKSLNKKKIKTIYSNYKISKKKEIRCKEGASEQTTLKKINPFVYTIKSGNKNKFQIKKQKMFDKAKIKINKTKLIGNKAKHGKTLNLSENKLVSLIKSKQSLRIESLKLTSNKTLKKTKAKIISLNNPQNSHQNRLILLRNDFLKMSTRPQKKIQAKIKQTVQNKKNTKKFDRKTKVLKSKLIYSSISFIKQPRGLKSKIICSQKESNLVNSNYLKELKRPVKKPKFLKKLKSKIVSKKLKKKRGIQWTSLDFKSNQNEPFIWKIRNFNKSPNKKDIKKYMKTFSSIEKPKDFRTFNIFKKCKNQSPESLGEKRVRSIYDQSFRPSEGLKRSDRGTNFIFRKMKTLNGYKGSGIIRNKSINVV